MLQLPLNVTDECRAVSAAVTVLACPEHQEIPSPGRDYFRRTVGHPDRLTIVRCEPEPVARTGQVPFQCALDVRETVGIELAASVDDGKYRAHVCVLYVSYQRAPQNGDEQRGVLEADCTSAHFLFTFCSSVTRRL